MRILFGMFILLMFENVSAQLNASNFSSTVFKQLDWQGNRVWRDDEGAIILKERTYKIGSYTKVVQIVTGSNRKTTALLNSRFRYTLDHNGHVVVSDFYGNKIGKYVKGPVDSLLFQYNPRIFRWALPVGYEYGVI